MHCNLPDGKVIIDMLKTLVKTALAMTTVRGISLLQFILMALSVIATDTLPRQSQSWSCSHQSIQSPASLTETSAQWGTWRREAAPLRTQQTPWLTRQTATIETHQCERNKKRMIINAISRVPLNNKGWRTFIQPSYVTLPFVQQRTPDSSECWRYMDTSSLPKSSLNKYDAHV